MTGSPEMGSDTPFKQCTCCGTVWRTREDLLADPGVELIGYQAHFIVLVEGLFLFNHSCGTTFALDVAELVDLYAGPVFRRRLDGSADCLGYCIHRGELQPCPAECECAFVREIMQVVRRWPKRAA
jgi:hypothetical protein